jgi:hypothetical protein
MTQGLWAQLVTFRWADRLKRSRGFVAFVNAALCLNVLALLSESHGQSATTTWLLYWINTGCLLVYILEVFMPCFPHPDLFPPSSHGDSAGPRRIKKAESGSLPPRPRRAKRSAAAIRSSAFTDPLIRYPPMDMY